MTRIMIPCLTCLLLTAVPAAAGHPDYVAPFHPPAVWYGWGGNAGQMWPVEPHPIAPHAPGHAPHPPAIWYGWGGAVGVLFPVDPHHSPHPLPLMAPVEVKPSNETAGPSLSAPGK